MNPRARNRVVSGALILLIVLLVVGAALGAVPARAADAFTLTTARTPVGLATDGARSRYWALERTSGRLTLTALRADGTVEGEMNSRDLLINAQALAFENGEAYVADIGGTRSEVVIYRVTEPWPATEILRARQHRLTYPDGPHEAQAILVDSAQRIRIVTTGENPGIFEAPQEVPEEGAAPLARLAGAPEGVTDGVVLPDGRPVLRTATELLTLDPETWAVVAREPVDVPEEGQSVTSGLGANEVITALGPDGLVSRWTVPGPAPTGTPAPRPRAPEPAQQAPAEENRIIEQTNTTLALGAAGLVALLCALVVLVWRR